MALIDDCVAFTGPQEGCILWPYLDSVGNPTIGVGHLLYSELYARTLFPDVTVGDFDDQWDTLLSTLNDHPASFYETATELRITQAQADALFRSDLDCHIAACQRRVPGFDALPGPVQVACVDIDYNAGDIRKFPKMLACIAAGDWQGAAEESNRPQLPARSEATKALILSVATDPDSPPGDPDGSGQYPPGE